MRKCECESPFYPDRCDIQQNSAPDGSQVEDFSGAPFKSGVPCHVISTGGDETFRGRQIEARVSAAVEMPYIAGILPTMRLLITSGIYKGEIFNIAYVKPMRKAGQPPKLTLYCAERVPV